MKLLTIFLMLAASALGRSDPGEVPRMLEGYGILSIRAFNEASQTYRVAKRTHRGVEENRERLYAALNRLQLELLGRSLDPRKPLTLTPQQERLVNRYFLKLLRGLKRPD